MNSARHGDDGRVWVVDDDRSIRWVLERALEQEGIDPISFESGDDLRARCVVDLHLQRR